MFMNVFWSSLIKGIPILLKSHFKWFFILFTLWLYRVDFMAADAGGIAKALQVISIFGFLILIQKSNSNFIGKAYGKFNYALKSILWLYLFAVISTLWAYIPAFSFFLSFQNVVLIFVLSYIFSKLSDFGSMEKMFVFIAVFCMLFEAIGMRITYSPTFFIHCLPAGSTAATCLSYCIGELLAKHKIDKQRKGFLKSAIVLSAIVLITSTSSGANISAVIGVSIALLISGKFIYAIPLLSVALFIFFNPSLYEPILLFLMPGKTMEIVEIGNGRETIWDAIVSVAMKRPTYGWGFACGERVAGDQIDWSLSDAHNNYLGLFGGLGFIGVGLFVLHQIITIWTLFFKRFRIGYAGFICAFCCASINGYSYGYISGKACSITVVYFAMLVFAFVSLFTKVYGRQIVK